MGVDLKELRQLVYDRLEQNSVFYEVEEVDYALNEAVAVFNLGSRLLQATYNFTSRANRVIYDVPREILLPTRVDWEKKTLEPWGLTEVSQASPDWLKQTTAQSNAEPAHWISIGNNKLAIHPADSYGGRVVSVTGVIEPVRMVNASDPLALPGMYSNSLADYATHVLVMDEGGVGFSATMPMFASFNENVQVANVYTISQSRTTAQNERIRN